MQKVRSAQNKRRLQSQCPQLLPERGVRGSWSTGSRCRCCQWSRKSDKHPVFHRTRNHQYLVDSFKRALWTCRSSWVHWQHQRCSVEYWYRYSLPMRNTVFGIPPTWRCAFVNRYIWLELLVMSVVLVIQPLQVDWQSGGGDRL